MGADTHAIADGQPNGVGHAGFVTDVATTGNVAARHFAEQKGIVRFTLAEVSIQVYARSRHEQTIAPQASLAQRQRGKHGRLYDRTRCRMV